MESGIDGNREKFPKFSSLGIESADSGNSKGQSPGSLLELLPLRPEENIFFISFFPVFLLPEPSCWGVLDSPGILEMQTPRNELLIGFILVLPLPSQPHFPPAGDGERLGFAWGEKKSQKVQ